MSNFDVLLDQRLSDARWPEGVRVIRVSALGADYEVWAEGVSSQRLYKRLIAGDALAELAASVTQQADFGGDPQLFALGVEARRIKLGYTFDPFFAVSTSRIDPLPHQLEAVYGVLLKKPRVRFLLADDPGAGKTVMAGLLLKELKYRGVIERILVITPANLSDQWRREMLEKFGERFEVMNRATVDASYGENPWQARNQVITSVDFAKQDARLEQLRHTRWDLVIVDEAHKLSAKKYGNEVKRSLRYQLGEVLSETSSQLLFLTATPHQGDDEQFRLLLNLLEEDLFANRDLLEEAARNGENPILLRRLKENMTDFEGRPIFTPRFVHTPEFRLTPSERKLYEDVTEYVSKHFKRAWAEQKRNVGLAMTVLQRRLASSTHAIARSLENRHRRLSKLRDEVGRLDDDPYLNLSEEDLEDMPEEQRWAIENDLAERLTLARNLPDLDFEIAELDNLAQQARTLARVEQDRKLDELLKILTNLHGEKLLVFTEHKDTLDFIVRVLRKQNYAVTQIDGSMNLEARVAAEREFRDKCQVMVATEAAGEGINLQFCSVMVNYDLPWNPTRLEQRMGRVHRYGQKYTVNIYNLVAQGTREGDVLGRLLQKLEAMREQLGSDRVYDVVGELLGDIKLETLIQEHLTGRKTLAEVQAIVDARVNPEQLAYYQEITLDSLAQRELDLTRLKEQKQVSDLQRLQPEYVERFFVNAFRRLGGTVERRQDGLWRLRIPFEVRRRSERVDAQYLRVTFNPRVTENAEFIAPGHPLFDAVLDMTTEAAAPVLNQGAGFYLPQIDESGLLGYVEIAVVDGYGNTVSKRLYTARQNAATPLPGQTGGMIELPPRILVDAEPNAAPAVASSDVEVSGAIFRAWAHDEVLPGFLQAVKSARLREVDIRRQSGTRSLKHLIRQSTMKLAEHRVKERKGDDMALVIGNEERRQRELQERLAALEDRLAKEASLSPEPATLVALAHVTPLTSVALPNEDDPAVRKQVELAAMAAVMAFETSQGRHPEDVSADNVGFDILSSDRAIEVKGRAGVGAIIVTPNEWITAGRLGDEYYLYVVTHALTNPKLHIIRNPAANIDTVEELSVVRHVIPQGAWQRAATLNSAAAEEA